MPSKDKKRNYEAYKRWKEAHPEEVKRIHDRCKWKSIGLSPYKAQQIYESSNVCAICGKEVSGKDKHLDHEHFSHKIRGVLCYRCNSLLGISLDDVNLLTKAIQYLKENEIK
jgi:DNA-directed RNA polymerase subunit RPC12/RpoP